MLAFSLFPPPIHPLCDCHVNYSRMTQPVLPPLAKSGDARRKSGPSPSATQTCCYNSSQEEDFHWPRCHFLYCTLIKSILFQRQCPTVVLWGHATTKFKKKKISNCAVTKHRYCSAVTTLQFCHMLKISRQAEPVAFQSL